MTDKKINKHELRARETRELLLEAAKTIFVRDGYEGAELGEIACLAGRTKGAIYAHFKSKEDIFLALIEEHTARSRAKMAEMLAMSTGPEENLAAYRKFYQSLAEDQTWALLFLEFKLFAIRHPESREKLQRHFDEVIPGSREKELIERLGSPGEGPDAISLLVAIKALHPLISALAVERKLMPNVFSDDALSKLANRIFDALMPTPPRLAD